MSRGQNPLVLMMALSLPSTAGALGLGDIHVDSALDEPLAAEIDIVGASAEDLLGLTAAVANKETFAHLNADRPAFLQSTTFKVAKNSRGRPVLAIRSTESFSEPLVDLVVDLRWHNGELIRQYSLLLDPAGLSTADRLATAAPSVQPRAGVPLSAAPPAAAPPAVISAPSTALATSRPGKQVKVGAKATLRGVAWRVGARSELDLQTLMYAIFQANPTAFDGNINRLHRGALLNIPSAADVAALSKSAASREVHSQMTAWRGDTQGTNTVSVATQSQAATPVNAAPPLDASATAALNHRMQSLEKNLSDMQALFDREHDRMLGLQAQLTYAEKNKPVLGIVQAAPVGTQRSIADVIAAGLVLAGAFGVYFYWQRRRQPARPAPLEAAIAPQPTAAAVATMPAPAPAPATVMRAPLPSPRIEAPRENRDERTDVMPSLASRILDDIDIASLESSYMEEALENSMREESLVDTTVLEESEDKTIQMESVQTDTPMLGDTDPEEEVNLENSLIDDTVNLHVDSATLPAATMIVPLAPMTPDPAVLATAQVDTTKLDYNLVDLDLTAQHVHMPSGLNEPVVVKERRTNLVDVLKMAIDREPDRRDLRMKLLETYYAAAAANRQGFLDAVQRFARERDYLPNGEWDKISYMGRQIAGDTPLFADESRDKDDLAHCA